MSPRIWSAIMQVMEERQVKKQHEEKSNPIFIVHVAYYKKKYIKHLSAPHCKFLEHLLWSSRQQCNKARRNAYRQDVVSEQKVKEKYRQKVKLKHS